MACEWGLAKAVYHSYQKDLKSLYELLWAIKRHEQKVNIAISGIMGISGVYGGVWCQIGRDDTIVLSYKSKKPDQATAHTGGIT